MQNQIKEVRQVVAWAANELNRRKIKRKATKKEKKIMQKLEKWADQQIKRNDEMLNVKERALDEPRYRKVKLERTRSRDAKLQNNRMFEEDQAIFFRKTQGAKEKKGKVPKIKEFEDFWAGIWEDETQTPHRKGMNMVARKLSEKVTDVQEFNIDDKKLHETVKKRKNWTAPGIDGIQNFRWKKLTGTWKAITDCVKKWVEQSEEIPYMANPRANSATTKNGRCKQREELPPNNVSEHHLQDLHRNDRNLYEKSCRQK